MKLNTQDIEFTGSSREFKIVEDLMLTPLNEIGDLIKDLKAAIKSEAESEKSYTLLAKRVKDQNQKDLLNDLAHEEHRHKNMLENELKRLK